MCFRLSGLTCELILSSLLNFSIYSEHNGNLWVADHCYSLSNASGVCISP